MMGLINQGKSRSPSKGILASAVAGSIAILGAALVMALTPAGVVIRNQATATYLDSNLDTQSTSSNQVSTTVQEVLGLTLVAGQTKFAVASSSVYFPHFLTNAGNATESYTLCLDQTGLSDDFDTTLALYLDADEDGLPDTPGSPLPAIVPSLLTPSDGCYAIAPLEGGGAVQVVVEAVIDASPGLGDQSLFQLTAYTDTGFDDGDPATGLEDTDTDAIEITDAPIIEIIKSIDVDQGLSPSGPYVVTLTYRNTGLTDAQDLRIEELLPTQTFTGDPGGMTYVAGSARWSHELATEVVLTDVDETVADIDENSVEMLFCAYDASCDTGDFQTDRMVAIIDSIPAGEEGSITFDVDIESGIAENEALVNVVNFVYYDTVGPTLVDDGGSDFASNSVTFVIIADSENPGVVANSVGSVVDTDNITEGADDGLDADNIVYEEFSYDDVDPLTSVISQGGEGFFYNYIWNSGDGEDTFDIELDNVYQRDGATLLSTPFDPASVFQLLKPDGINTLVDTDGDSIPDTGPLDPGEGYLVILKIAPPSALVGDNSGFGWDINMRATSSVDANLSNAVTNHLSVITQSEIDLTNAETRDAGCVATPVDGCDGEGDGPYAYPANTYAVDTGSTIYMPLWAHNIGGAGDAFDLAYSDTNAPFTGGSIPAGISITFYSVTGAANTCEGNLDSVISNTGTISPSTELLACAEIMVDSDVVADGVPIDLYFRALSPTTAESDIKFDRLVITQAPALEFIPEHSGQVGAGQFIVYPHLITNTGNTNLECLNVTATDDLAGDNWSNNLYLDVDGDSSLDLGTDIPLVSAVAADLVLAPTESLNILVKVFSPAGALEGVINTTALDLVANVDDNDADPETCTGAVLALSLNDTTQVSNSTLSVVKSQALDAACDGTADTGFVTTQFQVNPSQCVIYQLYSANVGTEVLYNLVTKDITPPYTSYEDAADNCSVVGGGAGTPETPTGPPGCVFVNPLSDGATGEVRVDVDYLEAGGSITVNFAVRVE